MNGKLYVKRIHGLARSQALAQSLTSSMIEFTISPRLDNWWEFRVAEDAHPWLPHDLLGEVETIHG